ncbi:sigma-70 family RNA polymerase sigma factor [Acuticoccus sp. MNP-M23]|uniref:sigma-70 family RNA polymerase sigma factor n=1 Tax=Acuticoccus sp. MNP-M23 TaxID=3072793 RepID=UPI0028168D6E|nr:sigma-70 family RNA polymerase sigma factor [Acuticoccus sp. MNP-M23]WMS42086.1 sigma-70 family RNA polymerase sigma factor [Acuticoccus sp. MNP-M23]
MTVREELIRQIPNLRAFAVSLSGNAERADDLVQEALMKAWASIDMFEPGTNMRAWLFTILRNVYYSDFRKKRREVEDADGKMAANLATHPEQLGHLDMVDFREALGKLASDQREALVLVGASGFSYDEAAEICGCAVGTVKSRVNRARTKLAELLSVQSGGEYGPDHHSRSVVDSRKF